MSPKSPMSPMSPMSGAMSSFTWRLLLLPADLLLAALSWPESSRASAVRYNVTIQPAAGTGNMKLQNVHCSCTVGNLWDLRGQKFWNITSILWDIANVSFDSMIKDAWESTQSTSRSAFRMHKMAMKLFRQEVQHYNVHVTTWRHTVHCLFHVLHNFLLQLLYYLKRIKRFM